ncbi:hypothetical protein NIES2101_35725 [Calothrix sp. HK-06]|nr:hypothetical protein NIES2101_35725 [Calothrix sp. HK-06]
MRILSAGGLLLLMISAPAFAQTESTGDAETTEVYSFGPRLGVRYTTEGAGVEAFTSLEGFVPILQNPGQNITFLQGRLLLDDRSTMAGTLLLGHRFVSENGKRIGGIYASYDTRNTGDNTFNQLGFGFESLGNVDFRANVNLPVSNGRQLINNNLTGVVAFQGNSLFPERTYDVALHGIDAEVGTRLAKIGSGDVRGYAGAYYYAGNDVKDTFGWKTRLVIRPTDFINLGVSLQNDALFDTRAVFTVGVTLPGSGATKGKTENGSAASRLGELVERQDTIAVKRENSIYYTDSNRITVINPVTGAVQPLKVTFVAPGATGTGTAEAPSGNFATALSSAATGDVVYVQGNPTLTAATTAGFRVPTGVQLLSTGPVQTVNTVELGAVKLPNSGSGLYPVLTVPATVGTGAGIVTLSSNSTLSGFDVRVPTTSVQFSANGVTPTNLDARGIVGSSISNVTVANNIVSGARREAIDLSQVTGNVTINNNTVRNSGVNAGENAIRVLNSQGTVNLGIANNTITNNNGILASLSGTATGTATIANNTISPTRTGISLRVSENANLTSTTTGNTINGTTTSTEGVVFRAFGNGQGTTTISNNRINNIAGRGVAVEVSDTAKPQVIVSGNTITGSRTNGINVLASGNADTRVTVSGNTVNNTTGIGVEVTASEAAKLRFGLTSNTISNSGSLSVSILGSDTSNTSVIADNNTLTNNNTVTGTQNPPTPSAFDIAADAGNLAARPTVCVRLNNNRGSGNTVADYSLYNGNSATNGAIFQVENGVFATNTGRITLQAFNGTTIVPATVTPVAIGGATISTGSGFTSVASGFCPN